LTVAPIPLASRSILGMRVDGTSYADATERIFVWARAGGSRMVSVATVNNVMCSVDDASYLAIMNGSDLVTPDGMPLVWGLRALGVRDASRVYGPELTPMILRRAANEGIPIALVGGTPSVLEGLVERATRDFPDLQVVYRVSPPFRPLTPGEESEIVRGINESGARIILVGLGTPKQEAWMARYRGSVDGVMVGVGAAFDFLAGAKPQAPRVVRRAGLEWLFRLVTEPRRLWRRYLRQNPRFVALFGRQVLRERLLRSSGKQPSEPEEAL
jgi:N-acetylglucosaminyldiphosphoundecaprenol N-acetyl-beta-D-mannosaminyltransferase